MKITHATASVSSLGGGIPVALAALVEEQTRLGLDPSVIGHEDDGDALHEWNATKVTSLPTNRGFGMRWATDYASALGQSEPDLVHTHGLWAQPSLSVPYTARKSGAQHVVSPHGMLDPWALQVSPWKKRLAGLCFERKHLRESVFLHALCASEADSLRAYGLTNPIAVIPNGVKLPENDPVATTDPQFEEKILLFLGRIHPKKGLENALRAWASLSHSDREGWDFVIAGWDQGRHRAELEQLCREFGISVASVSVERFLTETPKNRNTEAPPSVLFTGPAFGKQKDTLLRRADAFILPSFSEGLPMAVLEAWAYRLPVLMTNFCNLPEGFEHDAAIRIETNIESIADGLKELMQAPLIVRKTLGENGRSLVERQFTWHQVAARMKNTYEWALGTAPKPDCLTIR